VLAVYPNIQRATQNSAVLRRTIADLNALLLPGDGDLQQAVMCTLAQLLRNSNQQIMQATNNQNGAN
jgi:type II secretory pathway component PulJ